MSPSGSAQSRRGPVSTFITLMEEWVTPMMRPRLAERLDGPEGLRELTLLHQEDLVRVEPDISWDRWFEVVGLGPAPEGGPRFNQADHALDAAVAGAGVVLGRISLAEKDLTDGRLVAPFPQALSMPSKTRLICLETALDRPAVRAFLDWITAETTLDPLISEGRQMIPASPV